MRHRGRPRRQAAKRPPDSLSAPRPLFTGGATSVRRRGAAADVQGRPDDRGGCALRHAHPEVPTTRGDHRPHRVRPARCLLVARRLPAAGGLGDAAAQASVGACEPLGRGGGGGSGQPRHRAPRVVGPLFSHGRLPQRVRPHSPRGLRLLPRPRTPARSRSGPRLRPTRPQHRGGLHRATGPERSALAARVPGAQETLRSLPKAVEPTALGRSPACRWSPSCWACARTTPPPRPRATGSPAAPTVRGRTGGVRAHPEP